MIETAIAVSDRKVTADETPPILEIGGQGVYIPYQHTWAHERVNVRQQTCYELKHLGQLPEFIARMETMEF